MSLVHVAFGYFHEDRSGHAVGTDDAFISYRYACNLASGHGLVFNPGERVEGYSNLLYTIAIAGVCAAVGPDRAYASSVALNLIALMIAIRLFERALRRAFGHDVALLGAALLSSSPAIWIAVGSGLETTAVLLVHLGVWSCLVQPGDVPWGRLVAWSVTAVLLRADGFVIPILAAGYLWATGRVRAGSYQFFAVALSVSLVSAWRYAYYGALFPNTFYAKVVGDGISRAVAGIATYVVVAAQRGLWVYALPLAWEFWVACWQWPRTRWRERRLQSATAWLGMGWSAYFCAIGGDGYGERMLLLLIPLGAVMWCCALQCVPGRVRIITFGLVFGIALAPIVTDVRFRYQVRKYDRWVTLGRMLRSSHPEATLAVDAAGKVPYYSGLRAFDLLGLTDPAIARGGSVRSEQPGHRKFDPDYVLARQPKLIAAWIEPDLDLLWGLSRERYERAGYKLRYLVNTSSLDAGTENVVDVRGVGEAEIVRLVVAGYGYAVLERK